MLPATHDLLRLKDRAALIIAPPPPAWVEPSLRHAPWVVACRRPMAGPLVPVGIRGKERHERQLAWLADDDIAECVTPEMLTGQRGWLDHPRRGDVPALDALEATSAVMRRLGLSWGPAGSVAFELASGLPTATETSDLDLVIRWTTLLTHVCALVLSAALADLPVGIDALIETVDGAVSLTELAGNAPEIVLRTLTGPRLMRALDLHRIVFGQGLIFG